MTMSVSQLIHHLLLFLVTFFTLPYPATPSIDSLVYCGCSQYRYMKGSAYESNVNSMLTSLVNSATTTTPYNQFTIPDASTATPDTVYGFFQCRGDLSSGDCFNCVSSAVRQLGAVCVNSAGGAMQLQGCFLKYDNVTFLGIEDKTILFKKCGSVSAGADALSSRDVVLSDLLVTADGPYRSSASSGIQAMGQCVQHIDKNKCQDCLTDAIGQLKTICATSKSGDMFLATCYVRYSEQGNHFSNRSHRPTTWSTIFIVVLLLNILMQIGV